MNKIAHLQGRAHKTLFHLYVHPRTPQVLEALALREEPPDVEDLEDSTLPLLDEAAPHIQKFKASYCPWAPRCCCGGCSPSACADPRRQLQAARHAGGWRTQLGRARILHFAAAHPLHYSPAPTHPRSLSSQTQTRSPSSPSNPHLQDVVYGPGYNEDIHPPEKKKGGAKRKTADPADAAQLKEEVEQLDIQVWVGLAAAGQEAEVVRGFSPAWAVCADQGEVDVGREAAGECE